MADVAPPDPTTNPLYRDLVDRFTAAWAEEPVDAEDSLDLIAAYIRAAYGLGYTEALQSGPRPPASVS